MTAGGFVNSGFYLQKYKYAQFIGKVDRNVYMYTTNKSKLHLLLMSFDSDSLTINGMVPIKGFKSKKKYSTLFNMKIMDVFIAGEKIVILWNRKDQEKAEVSIQIFDKELNELQEPKILCMATYDEFNELCPNPFYTVSPDGDKIAIGFEMGLKNKANVKLFYKLFDSNLKVVNNVLVEFPYSLSKGTAREVTSRYKMDNNGVLFFDVGVITSSNNKKDPQLKAHMIGNVMPDDSKLNYHIVYTGGRDLFGLEYLITEDALICFGLYGKTMENEQRLINGVFYTKLNSKTLDVMDEHKFLEYTLEKITFTNKAMSKKDLQKQSSDEFALRRLMSEKPTGNEIFNFQEIDEIVKTPDGGYVLCIAEKSLFVTQKALYTRFHGLNFVSVSEDIEVKWITCLKAEMEISGRKNYIRKMSLYNDALTGIFMDTKEDGLYSISLKNGKTSFEKLPFRYYLGKYNYVDNQVFGYDKFLSKYIKL